jgi:cytochrome c
LIFAPPAPGQPASRSVADGVYSQAQAKRGEIDSGEECARCHSASLLGGENNAPPLVGDAFQSRWKERTLGDLFRKISTTMPTDSPGRLSKSEYIDILAFILNANQYPSGQTDLRPDIDSLQQIKMGP